MNGLSVVLESIRYERRSIEFYFSIENYSDDNSTSSGTTSIYKTEQLEIP